MTITQIHSLGPGYIIWMIIAAIIAIAVTLFFIRNFKEFKKDFSLLCLSGFLTLLCISFLALSIWSSVDDVNNKYSVIIKTSEISSIDDSSQGKFAQTTINLSELPPIKVDEEVPLIEAYAKQYSEITFSSCHYSGSSFKVLKCSTENVTFK